MCNKIKKKKIGWRLMTGMGFTELNWIRCSPEKYEFLFFTKKDLA